MPDRRTTLVGIVASTGLAVLPARGFGQAPVSAAWTIPTSDRIAALLADRIDRQRRGVGLAVGVVEPQGRRIITYGSSGNARPLDGDTLFQIGSVTKVFTTLLLADMVVRGEVALDQPAAELLPGGVRLRERGRAVALRDLATHLSGLPAMPTNFDLRARPDPIAAYTASDLYAFLSGYEPPRAPGAAFEYSNLGVALLGRLLARRVGGEYEAHLRERILAPLRLASTSVTVLPGDRPRLAEGHDRYRRQIQTWEMHAMPASGSLRSSTNDLLTFLSAYLSGSQTPLRAAADLQLAQPRPSVGPSQGLGLMVRRTEAGTTYGFNGSKEGFMSFVGFDPAARTGVVVLSNNRPDDGLDALGLHILTGRPLPPAAPLGDVRSQGNEASVPVRPAAWYDGAYMAGERRFVVAALGSRLLLQHWGDGIDEFFAADERTFRSRINEDELTFTGAGIGPPSGLALKSGTERIDATRLR